MKLKKNKIKRYFKRAALIFGAYFLMSNLTPIKDISKYYVKNFKKTKFYLNDYLHYGKKDFSDLNKIDLKNPKEVYSSLSNDFSTALLKSTTIFMKPYNKVYINTKLYSDIDRLAKNILFYDRFYQKNETKYSNKERFIYNYFLYNLSQTLRKYISIYLEQGIYTKKQKNGLFRMNEKISLIEDYAQLYCIKYKNYSSLRNNKTYF